MLDIDTTLKWGFTGGGSAASFRRGRERRDRDAVKIATHLSIVPSVGVVLRLLIGQIGRPNPSPGGCASGVIAMDSGSTSRDLHPSVEWSSSY